MTLNRSSEPLFRQLNPAAKPLRVIGLMSGTSADGIDAACIETDGVSVSRRLGAINIAYDDAVRTRIVEAMTKARGLHDLVNMRAHKDWRNDLEKDIAFWHAEAVLSLLKELKLSPQDIDLVGFHGQTLDHQPAEGYTWQAGDARWLAHRLDIPVYADFRSDDVASGGQGAPLVPLYHAALAKEAGLVGSANLFVNIGGVANLSWVKWVNDCVALQAFDTGPGNALMDDWIFERSGVRYDADGAIASKGRVNQSALETLMRNQYFSGSGPKSLDRNDFSVELLANLSLEDGLATLSQFTAETIALGVNRLPEKPTGVFICGGGRHNSRLMTALDQRLEADTRPIDVLGFQNDYLEAEAFAYLAVRGSRGLSLSLPETTGVSAPMTGGRLFKPLG